MSVSVVNLSGWSSKYFKRLKRSKTKSQDTIKEMVYCVRAAWVLYRLNISWTFIPMYACKGHT